MEETETLFSPELSDAVFYNKLRIISIKFGREIVKRLTNNGIIEIMFIS